MNISQKITWFWKDPKGRLATFAIIVGAIVIWVAIDKKRSRTTHGTNPETVKPVLKESSTVVAEVSNNIPMMTKPPAPQPPEEKRVVTIEKNREMPVIDLYTAKEEEPSSSFAAYGRLVPCKLVITVDSARIQTPIVGLVSEDVYSPTGALVIPAGTEVHGTAMVDRMRERIASQNQWVLVYQDGRELKLTGIALDQAKDPDGRGWNITDGSAGLKGDVIKTDNLAEIKFFAATAIAGFAEGFQEQTLTQTPFGTTELTQSGGVKNAVVAAAGATATQYAQQILQRIQQDGFFVRVPAGSTFYLYVTEPIDEQKALVAGSKKKE